MQTGDIFVLDNLGSHKGKTVRSAIRNAGAKLIFLLKYSADLNAIEQIFAKLKGLLGIIVNRYSPPPHGGAAAVMARNIRSAKDAGHNR
jgi:transposase